MRDRVNFVISNSPWDDNFDEVGPQYRILTELDALVTLL